MDEKEYVERSLKTVLRLSLFSHPEYREESKDDDFLPFELYLGYDLKKLDEIFYQYKDQNVFHKELYKKYTLKVF